jgi:hypothetical protein
VKKLNAWSLTRLQVLPWSEEQGRLFSSLRQVRVSLVVVVIIVLFPLLHPFLTCGNHVTGDASLADGTWAWRMRDVRSVIAEGSVS